MVLKKIAITGTAGFIGSHLAKKLIKKGYDVVGIDNINDYYDIRLKYGRLKEAGIDREKIEYNKVVVSDKYDNYKIIKLNLEDRDNMFKFFEKEEFSAVCNLAAQAGVRYSLENPYSYIESNISGFMNILEICRQFDIKNLSFASSSSVYGLNKKQPFSEKECVSHPVSLYAATKKANELMAHSYSHLYKIQATGLRFFTVYGPWGRPDMALFKFVKNILEDKPIDVYNYGNMQRDFTYIDDIVEGVFRVIENPAKPEADWDAVTADNSTSSASYRIYNIGNNAPVSLMEFIETIEEVLGKKARKNLMPMQAGDVESTYADSSLLSNSLGYKPSTSIEEGVRKFISWFRKFYGI